MFAKKLVLKNKYLPIRFRQMKQNLPTTNRWKAVISYLTILNLFLKKKRKKNNFGLRTRLKWSVENTYIIILIMVPEVSFYEDINLKLSGEVFIPANIRLAESAENP